MRHRHYHNDLSVLYVLDLSIEPHGYTDNAFCVDRNARATMSFSTSTTSHPEPGSRRAARPLRQQGRGWRHHANVHFFCVDSNVCCVLQHFSHVVAFCDIAACIYFGHHVSQVCQLDHTVFTQQRHHRNAFSVDVVEHFNHVPPRALFTSAATSVGYTNTHNCPQPPRPNGEVRSGCWNLKGLPVAPIS